MSYGEQPGLPNKNNIFCTLIQENTFNQAVLFNTEDKMLNRKAQNKLPSYDNASCLANKFADFFFEKIQTLQNNISTNLTPTECNFMLFDVPKTVTELHEFGYISKEELAPLLWAFSWEILCFGFYTGQCFKRLYRRIITNYSKNYQSFTTISCNAS